MTAGARLPGNPSNALPPPCPMTAGARLPGNPSNALPPPCPIPNPKSAIPQKLDLLKLS
ncbi:MAG: hypothetical protein ACHBN1_07460 [Heteroscytonema crispum UTEX LB 1556]